MIKVSEIAKFLKKDYIGKNILVKKSISLDKIEKNSLVFLNKKNIKNIPNLEALILVPKGANITNSRSTIIEVNNPRLSFGRIVRKFFIKKNYNKGIHNSTLVGKNCKIHKSVSIGANCVIGEGVKIGENSVLNNNVIISDNVIIGKYCYFKSGAVIGEDGFGFELEKNKSPERIPHTGSVVIGSHVEVGSNNTIARGTINNTIIEDHVKIDDNVHIAHNCCISKNTIITACVEISGSVKVGKNCWIGPNSSIIQKINIGNNCTIGIGAILTKDVKDNSKIMGLNSIDLKSLVRFKKRLKYDT